MNYTVLHVNYTSKVRPVVNKGKTISALPCPQQAEEISMEINLLERNYRITEVY